MRLVLTTALLLTLLGAPSSAQQQDGPVRFIPTEQVPDRAPPIRVHATFKHDPQRCPALQTPPLHAAYPGILEVGRRADGHLYLITELTFPHYLEGIAEVPLDWPMEALKSQVVAARTFAMGRMNPSDALARELDYDLCATDFCQVYRGLNVSGGAFGGRWKAAVEATSGEILQAGSRPADTFYFSTSNGRTYSNQEIFGGSPRSYLKPVEENDDTESPLRRWEATISLGDLAEILRRAGRWGSGAIDSVVGEDGNITVSGPGASRTFSVRDFRIMVNNTAPCLTPKRYPNEYAAGRRLPQTIPSRWLAVVQEGSAVKIRGEGWGHGVGMVQWGLKGKADRGLRYSDMLAFYYGGLRPQKVPEPSQIRIGIAIDVTEVLVELAPGVTLSGAPDATGGFSQEQRTFRITGGDRLSIEPGPPPPTELAVTVTRPATTDGSKIALGTDSASAIRAELLYEGAASGSLGEVDLARGEHSTSWDAGGLGADSYRFTLRATDGVDTVRVPAGEATVATASPSPSEEFPTETAADAPESDTTPLGLVAVVLLALGMAAVGTRAAKRRLTSP